MTHRLKVPAGAILWARGGAPVEVEADVWVASATPIRLDTQEGTGVHVRGDASAGVVPPLAPSLPAAPQPSPEREVINPHDAIFIAYTDPEAARMAVLIVGNGAYGIEGDDGLPLLLFGASEWVADTYGLTVQQWFDRMDRERLATALESMRLKGERSSLSDPVGVAHRLAANMRAKVAAKAHSAEG